MKKAALLCTLLAGLALLASACSAAAASTLHTPTAAAGCATVSESAICAPALPAQATPGAMVQPVGPVSPAQPGQAAEPATQSALPPTASPTPIPATPTAAPSPTAPAPKCSAEACTYASALFLARPILPPGRDSVDPSYRFGSTAGGTRDPHHGVEFLNGTGTPVHAAAGGRVVVAGDDRKTFYGPYSYFYGNLVVIEHPMPAALQAELPGLPDKLYTLYGHLSKVEVQEGQQVQAGDEIGLVGMTGVATGSHLHFEVRLGENTYAASQNPELWLAPRLDPGGTPMGALAAGVLDQYANPIKGVNFVIERLASPDGAALGEQYGESYAEKKLLNRPPYYENFAVNDLPAGWYRLSFIQNGFQQRVFQIVPGHLTVFKFGPEGK